jgi:phage-related baseplate assembly protein
MSKKIVPIKYTSRDFDSIKRDIIDHAKRYYPETYKDFSENSFGSFMVDSVAYIGDVLSYYLDYQVNEGFLDTAIEYNNVLKLGRQNGYKDKGTQSSIGAIAIYYEIPASSNGSPNFSYAPKILKGSSFSSDEGNRFTLMDDVVFNLDNVKIVVGQENENGPTTYVVKTYGRVISGVNSSETITFGAFEKFKKVQMSSEDVAEILSVTDLEGNEYFEVDYLSQNIIYRAVPNRNTSENTEAPSLLKPFQAFRRFIVSKEDRKTYLQFGSSADVSLNDATTALTEPSKTILDKYAKTYLTDQNFDPNILLDTDKFGIAPSNTSLLIRFRKNSNSNSNSSALSIKNIENLSLEFTDELMLDAASVDSVRRSFEVENEEAIIGTIQATTSDELKILIKDSYASQNRAVTQADYKALSMLMPSKFGSIKRVKAVRDAKELRRNLNLYVVSENPSGYLTNSNNSIKNNLKTWLNNNRMINDTIDVLDAKIVNFGIDFVIQIDNTYEKYSVLSSCIEVVKNLFSIKLEIGEPIFINTIYSAINRVDGVVDTKNVTIKQKVGGSSYSSYTFSFKENLSDDGTILYVPENVIMELKFLDQDIKGTIL